MAGFDWYASLPKTCTPVPLCSLTNLQLRFLCPGDIQEVKALCQAWFPIDYPYYWYKEITSNPRFYSLAAVYNGVIIGLVVAEIKAFSELNREDEDILAPTFGKDTMVAYLLSLGVCQEHRRNGIGSLLLDNLISHLTTSDNSHCKALFLHVLTTNTAAIHFYQRHQFKLHSFLPYYYCINGRSKDGFTYVLYVNEGHPPWGLLIMSSITAEYWLAPIHVSCRFGFGIKCGICGDGPGQHYNPLIASTNVESLMRLPTVPPPPSLDLQSDEEKSGDSCADC